MASSSGKKTSSSRKRSSKTSTGKSSKSKAIQAQQAAQDSALFHEIGLIILFVVMVFLFCCNFGIIGPVGNAISGVLFGLFGFSAYITPVLVFIAIAFWFANEGNPNALRKLIAGVVLFIILGIICDLFAGVASELEKYDIKELYTICSTEKKGGGILAGSLSYMLLQYLEMIGTILVVFLCGTISLILLTEKSILSRMKEGTSRLKEFSKEDAERRREYAEIRRQEQEEQRIRKEEERARKEEERSKREEERRLREEEKENEKILRMEKKVSGVTADTLIKKQGEDRRRDDIHEIVYTEEPIKTSMEEPEAEVHLSATENLVAGGTESFKKVSAATLAQADSFDFDKIQIRSMHQVTMEESATKEEMKDSFEESQATQIRIHKEGIEELSEPVARTKPVAKLTEKKETASSYADNSLHKEMQSMEKKMPVKYMFPPLSRLQKGVAATGDSTRELKETAMRLQQTLNTFGVRVTITDISQGPSVTRYELQPEQGVKVSKIVGLTDDIKLNLAATDIRIEAPIPGKAAIGIEVPNKENMMVALRDLFESKEFKEFPSNIAFAVGKDIAGKTVVADIAKMPHMLIAGATGSGKSVCINTLIMSILYKAHPDDVKLIMVDPKVVELSVYNGIPHLLIPVVTDPKKASAALHWGVSEMEDRYRKFADFNVRDLKGYNKKVETMRENGDENAPVKLPQIVIIVDELADLMMVCPGEVEESICRLAQLARAAGIHLIIATQRPSVDVITGLIKANMPSRVAFSVSSGVDSRTILDMNGAEKLLGKGDMLFYPQGYSKPARIQGAFVSDKEVSDVVDFLKNQTLGNTYAEDIEEKIKNIGSASGASGSQTGGGSSRDEYFEEAARFIIDKDKASIGMLQRVLKIGFNRAARIMDQLCEYGVVGEEEGTKPRKVLMSMEQFEQLLEEI
ncbi:MAG: DNA translocase FtsK [Lachnospiraceae bacterium]|nr:DNA translocase FtsK [Lachnospiraceae bacterium]